MYKAMLSLSVAGAIAPMVVQALDISVSGHVNRAIRFADNGSGSDVQHIDGSASKSRFRFTAEGEAMPGVTAGSHIEQGFAVSPSSGFDLEAPEAGEGRFDLHHSYLYFSGDFGKTSLGNAPVAGNGTMWTSHNGAWMGTEYPPDTSSGLGVTITDSGLSGYSVFSFFPSVNVGRANILRYGTPSIGPVAGIIKVDVRQHRAPMPKRKLKKTKGTSEKIENLVLMGDVLGFADGIAFANGTSVSAAWGWDDLSDQDYEDMYVNVAHTWGKALVAIDYRSTGSDANMEGRAVGLGAQYVLGGGVDVYVGFNNYSFGSPGKEVMEDVDAFTIGSPVVFK